jgi:hypothetical protein
MAITAISTFIDYEKVCDSVDRECIWIALREIGLPVKIVNIIKEGYNMFNCRVLHDGQMSLPFDTVSGVRKGCLLSPLLFLVVMDKVMRAVTAGSFRSITWKLTQTLEDLDYADDICLLSRKFVHMQDKINDLQQESIKAGLKINIGKTKEMKINAKNKIKIK